ncbi:MAG: ABC transporter ATP-binding protein [Candidatus Heimdallarchaeota archaeon]
MEIFCENVTKWFGDTLAVDDVTLHIQSGEYISILGPSGCGKTTLLRMISGLIQPTSGTIYFDQRDVSNLPPDKRNIGYVFQQFTVFPHMDVWENVSYGLRIRGIEWRKIEDRTWDALKKVYLTDRHDARPQELSAPDMQKVAIARALAVGAELFLFDEPLGHLDEKTRVEFREELRRLVKNLGVTAIHVTHDQEEGMAISDRVAVMRRGRLIQIDTPQNLIFNPKEIFVSNFIGESDFFEGVIINKTPNFALVELRWGYQVRTRPTNLDIGQRVVVAVRREFLQMKKRERERIDILPGSVTSARYIGDSYRVRVTLDNLEQLELRLSPNHKLARKSNPGDAVSILFNPEDTILYDYPPEGLLDAIAPI